MGNLTVIGYFIYLPIAIGLTYYVAYVLFKNSIVYMNDIFAGRPEVANATNNLFRIGFYLMNLGFALYILEISLYKPSIQELIERLSYKIGGFSIYLGVMLFLNMFLFFRGKRIAKQRRTLSSTVNP
ncbi:MAG: hypothetical protein LBJ04_14520 [Sphingobacterium sp.]|mgnify:FL=1|jgi:hypothetical protein|uniref:hypothetical protein n=1 Tax=Sphingobacterium sp. TaxID=341027 RepID=UPI00282AA77C|nr:hypothetical protein [Sphingobacterium sp.]MDR0264427.1 hypothetical protein [Sphingobacterium sp.]